MKLPKHMINILRDLRKEDPKGWLKPSEFNEAMLGIYELEVYLTKEAPGIRAAFNQSVPQFMEQLATNQSAENRNPENRKGKYRYPWSNSELSKWNSLKRNFGL